MQGISISTVTTTVFVSNHPYPQHPPNIQQFFPGFVPPVPLIAQTPHHFQNTNPLRLKLLYVQPIPTPNNKPTQALNSIVLQIIHPMLFLLYLCMRSTYDLEEL